MNDLETSILPTLSEAQRAAIDLAQQWLAGYDDETGVSSVNNRGWFVIAGYAGTGKSYSVAQLVSILGLKAAYMTYTGKAALVLRKYHRIPASTIHSRVYRPVFQDIKAMNALADELADPALSPERRGEALAALTQLQELKFELRPAESDDYGPAFPEDIIVLDECSMVDANVLEDLLSFRKPIIALGDPGQLPPVNKSGEGPREGALFMNPPEVMMTEIHRQAAGNPIIDWSMRVRKKIPIPRQLQGETIIDDRAVCFPYKGLSNRQLFEHMASHDITICWKNETRHYLNKLYRSGLELYQKSDRYPVAGDKIVCRANDKETGLLNGLFADVVEVIDIWDNTVEMMIRTELMEPDAPPMRVSALRAKFDEAFDKDAMRHARSWQFRNTQQFEFGYALTCHTSQGSQWPKVLVIDENVLTWPKVRDERARWLYTAFTRAAEKLTVLAS